MMREQKEKPDAVTREAGGDDNAPDDGERFLPATGDPMVSEIRRLLMPICEAEGLELVFVEFQRERNGRVLRVYLDREGGVTIEDCTRVSRQVRDLLDIYIDDRETYTLEVSSAGIERPLGRESDFIRFAGRPALIKTARPIEGRKRFKGLLLGLVDENVEIKVDNTIFAVPCRAITRAQLVNDDGVNQW